MVAPPEPPTRLLRDIEALCQFDRGSASPGEREAARWVASSFEDAGLQPELEDFAFYPDYWNVWGAHMLGALGAWLVLGRGSRRRRLLGAAVTSGLAASFWGDASARFHWLRRLFPARSSVNVLARLPNPQAVRLLIVSAHVDAAHSGLVFNPELLGRVQGRYAGGTVPPALVLPFRGLVSLATAAIVRAIGLPRALARAIAAPGGFICAATAALMANIRNSPVVPGANDDASGVAAVLALARELAANPPANMEVWFLVTGCEEGIEGGIHAFLAQHRDELEARRPFFLNMEMLGSGRTVYSEAEGHVTTFGMQLEAVSLLAEVAREPEFSDVEAITIPAQTDALAAHHYGFPAITVMSQAEEGQTPHYHWPSDTPENIDVASVERAYHYVRRVVDRLDAEGPA